MPEVIVCHDVPFGEVLITPPFPTATKRFAPYIKSLRVAVAPVPTIQLEAPVRPSRLYNSGYSLCGRTVFAALTNLPSFIIAFPVSVETYAFTIPPIGTD